MQGRAKLSRQKLVFLVAISIAAIGSLILAPEGAVGDMLTRMFGATNALAATTPRPVPPMSFLTEETKGKVVVVNFWALWCGSCRVEKPKLDKLAADYAKKGLVVLTLADGGANMDEVKEYFAEHHITHLKPIKDEGSTTFISLGFRGIPSTVILNKKGEEVTRAEGFVDWDDKEVRRTLDEILAQR